MKAVQTTSATANNTAPWHGSRPDEVVRCSGVAHQALAKAELRVPAELQGAFIAAGQSFDAFLAIGKVLATATTGVLIVDPYADAKLLTDYAVLAPAGVGSGGAYWSA